MRIAREEIFGPVATVIRAKDYEEALELANDTPFGLSSGICTTSLKYAGALQAQRGGRHGDGQPADRRRRLSCAVRRPKGLLRAARAGPLRQEFYTTVKTAYTFDGNGPYVPKTRASE